jgi:TRAP transporter 4TM/12TM fusion protein
VNLADSLFATGVSRKLSGAHARFAKPLSALVTIALVVTNTIWVVDLFAMVVVFLGAVLCLVFLSVGPMPESDPDRVPWYDVVLAALALATSLYLFVEIERIAQRIALLDVLTPADLFFGSVLLALTLEATRRTVGLALTLIVLAFLAYNLWGDALPGVFGHGVIDYAHFLDILVFTTDGIFGVPVRVALTYVFLFGLFGAFLHYAGGGEFFYNAAAAVSGRTPGGPAKIAVVSSGLYGTISGSPTADVVTTGSVTIPMMKRLGYSGALAGGVEVAASTGGAILPPVMGSAAFLMAEYTGIPYQSIVVAAIVPALLYYLSVYFQVHLRSVKLGLRGVDPSTIPPLGHTLRQGGLFAVPFAVLVGALIVGYSPQLVAAFATVALIAVAMLRRRTRLGLRQFYEVLADTTLRIAPAVGACAAAGLVVGGITMTGLAAKFTDMIFLLAGGNALASLVVAAGVVILLGMGMPVPSVYILAAVLVSPALIKLGLSTMAAHLFLLYFASLSAMTPPVAVAAFAAAPLAQANPLAIGMTAVRLAIVAFLVPFSFAYSEEVLLRGSPIAVTLHIGAASLAVICLGLSIEGFLRRPIPYWGRLLLGACGIALFAYEWRVQTVAAALATGYLAVGVWRSNSAAVGAGDRARS